MAGGVQKACLGISNIMESANDQDYLCVDDTVSGVIMGCGPNSVCNGHYPTRTCACLTGYYWNETNSTLSKTLDVSESILDSCKGLFLFTHF